MNSKGVVAIPRDKVNCFCMKCLKETTDLKNITICEMGYGSSFDGAGTKINLCNECYEKSNPEIWSMEVKVIDYYEEYLHEQEMIDYIETFPLQCRELVYNEFEYGWCADHKMEPQDWIDYQLDELPYEKCKEYYVYAPEEIRAYEERYPKCEYVYNIVWRDGSKGSSCAIGGFAFGEYGGKTGLNYSTNCYKCKYYKERVTPIKDINGEEQKDYELYIQSQVKNQELEEKFGY